MLQNFCFLQELEIGYTKKELQGSSKELKNIKLEEP